MPHHNFNLRSDFLGSEVPVFLVFLRPDNVVAGAEFIDGTGQFGSVSG